MKATDVIGNRYKLMGDGKVFTVLGAEAYPASKVSKRYKPILDFKPGLLVAISYRGALIPNITMEGGVVRITKIELKDKAYDRPHAISQAIGIKEDMIPCYIWKLK